MNNRHPTTAFVELSERGHEILENPLLNKSTAFTHDERTALDLNAVRGLPAQAQGLGQLAAHVWLGNIRQHGLCAG